MARARMKDEVTTDASQEAAELAAIEAALNGEGPDVDVQIDPVDIDVDTLAAKIAVEDAKDEAYADQVSEIDVSEAPELEPVEGETKTTKARKGRTVAPKGSFEEQMAAYAAHNVVLDSDEGELTADQMRAIAGSVSQKKVKEKVLNLLDFAVSGKTMSNYTKIAMDVVVKAYLDGCKPVTMKDIRAALEARGYKGGTVAAQAGQMLSLLPTLRIVKRNGSVLEPNPNSVILEMVASA